MGANPDAVKLSKANNDSGVLGGRHERCGIWQIPDTSMVANDQPGRV